MKGIAFHWEDPWKDIYSGLDPQADAWGSLANVFNYDLAAIQCNWPFPDRIGVHTYSSFEDFLVAVSGQSVVLADYQDSGTPNPYLGEIDWLVFGPASGWRGSYPEKPRWCYHPSPPGGYFSIHLAHIAAHIAMEQG